MWLATTIRHGEREQVTNRTSQGQNQSSARSAGQRARLGACRRCTHASIREAKRGPHGSPLHC